MTPGVFSKNRFDSPNPSDLQRIAHLVLFSIEQLAIVQAQRVGK